MNEKEIEAIKDLLSSEGWRLLIEDFRERERIELEALLSLSELSAFRERQAYIQALRRVIRRPRELITVGEQHDEKES